MIANKEKLDQQILNRLQAQGILLSNQVRTLNRFEALVLIGEAMLDKFVKEFVRLWKEELFAHCRLRDFELPAVAKQQIPGIQDPAEDPDRKAMFEEGVPEQYSLAVDDTEYPYDQRVVSFKEIADRYLNSYRRRGYPTFHEQLYGAYAQKSHPYKGKQHQVAGVGFRHPDIKLPSWFYPHKVDFSGQKKNLHLRARKHKLMKPMYKSRTDKIVSDSYRSLESYLKQCKEVEQT